MKKKESKKYIQIWSGEVCVWSRVSSYDRLYNRPWVSTVTVLLVMDIAIFHKTDAIKKRFKELKTTLALIPPGLTSFLQPLDTAVNVPFNWYPASATTPVQWLPILAISPVTLKHCTISQSITTMAKSAKIVEIQM